MFGLSGDWVEASSSLTMALPMSPATRASRAWRKSFSARGSAISGSRTGVGSGRRGGSSAIGRAGGVGFAGATAATGGLASVASGTRTITGLATVFSTILTFRDSSKRVAKAMPATSSCAIAINARPQSAIVNAGTFLFEDGCDDAGGMRGRWRRVPRLSMRRQDLGAVGTTARRRCRRRISGL